MNQTLMERWNRIVAPGDKVYVVGDFGNEGRYSGGYKTNIAIKEMTRLTTLRSASSCKQTQLDKENELSVHIIIGI